jgi:hypothetical protein
MAARLSLRWRAFHTWKHGNAAADYEDAAAGDIARGRFAVADGASEASFAAIWARLLVEDFVASPGKPWRGLDWIEPLQKRWAAAVDQLPLSWYAEEKRELGAFATFLGLVFRSRALGRNAYWRALAVGDCCLFQMRGGQLQQAFPMKRSADFGNRPELLGSRGQRIEELNQRCARTHGRWRSNDRFFLMTDALAQWFLLRTEQDGDPSAEIASLLAERATESVFAEWVEERRQQSTLRNDDVTLIVIDVK